MIVPIGIFNGAIAATVSGLATGTAIRLYRAHRRRKLLARVQSMAPDSTLWRTFAERNVDGLSEHQWEQLGEKLRDEQLMTGEGTISRGQRACCEYMGLDGRCIVHSREEWLK